ncbi:MAG: hypothetical protein RLZZ546_2965 [Bacteroidota bacterium]|jgi:hypothetical protein
MSDSIYHEVNAILIITSVVVLIRTKLYKAEYLRVIYSLFFTSTFENSCLIGVVDTCSMANFCFHPLNKPHPEYSIFQPNFFSMNNNFLTYTNILKSK